jgi:hypothetical protein
MNSFRSIPIVAVAAATLLVVAWLTAQSGAKSIYADHAYGPVPVELASR